MQLILLIVAGRWDYRMALGVAELLAIALLFINYALWFYGYCLVSSIFVLFPTGNCTWMAESPERHEKKSRTRTS